MVTASNVIVADRALKVLWDGDNGTELHGLFADEFAFRNLGGDGNTLSLDGLRTRVSGVRTAHANGHLEMERVVGDGNLVTIWWKFGDGEPGPSLFTLLSSWPEEPGGTCMLRVQDGKVAEMWEFGGQLAVDMEPAEGRHGGTAPPPYA